MAVVVDGLRAVVTGTFFDRPDIRATRHRVSPAGWRIPLDTTGLAPGEHRLTVLVWASPNGEVRYLEERGRRDGRPSQLFTFLDAKRLCGRWVRRRSGGDRTLSSDARLPRYRQL